MRVQKVITYLILLGQALYWFQVSTEVKRQGIAHARRRRFSCPVHNMWAVSQRCEIVLAFLHDWFTIELLRNDCLSQVQEEGDG